MRPHNYGLQNQHSYHFTAKSGFLPTWTTGSKEHLQVMLGTCDQIGSTLVQSSWCSFLSPFSATHCTFLLVLAFTSSALHTWGCHNRLWHGTSWPTSSLLLTKKQQNTLHCGSNTKHSKLCNITPNTTRLPPSPTPPPPKNTPRLFSRCCTSHTQCLSP